MDRYRFAQGTPAGLGGAVDSPAGDKLFPTDLKEGEWLQFPAAGFSQPACGLIRRHGNPATYGMPLGGVDTGCLAIDTDGTFGLCSIFNSFVPMRGPLRVPFLGMSVGKVSWVLSTVPFFSNESLYRWDYVIGQLEQTPSEIHYWGHFPVADLEYDTPGSPVSVGMRAWSPFIVGDSIDSNTPGAVFEVQLRNTTNTPQEGRLVFSFPGPTQEEVQVAHGSPRKRVEAETAPNRRLHTWVPVAEKEVRVRPIEAEGYFNGMYITSELDNNVGYALGVVGKEKLSFGGGLGKELGAWGKMGSAFAESSYTPPAYPETDFSRCAAVDFQLKPGEAKVVRFVLAWYAPLWIGEGDHEFEHMYATRFTNALDVAQFMARNHDSLLRRVLAWQQVLYTESRLPVWLRESLANILYLFPMVSLWAVSKPPIGEWCRKEDGLFGLLAGIIDWPCMEVISDSHYGNPPLAFFFPDLAVSEMRGHKAYQFPNGAAAWQWGGVAGWAKGGYLRTAGTDMVSPSTGFQTTVNGPCYVDMVDRLLMRTGDDNLVREFYPSVKKNTIYTMGLRPEDGADGIISVPSGNRNPEVPWWPPGFGLEWWEAALFFGMVTHVGGTHLAQLVMAERMAKKVGDEAFARQCQEWLEAGSRSMEEKMWAGSYYLLYNEPRTGKRSDLVFSQQLDGQWMVKSHGLPGVFRPDRVKTTLETIKRTNVPVTEYGATDLVTAEGKLTEGLGYGANSLFVCETFLLGATYMYEGQREFGLELVRRCQVALNQKWGYTWDQPAALRGDTGQKTQATNPIHNMQLWIVPAAALGQDLGQFCAPGGLVDSMIQAGKKDL